MAPLQIYLDSSDYSRASSPDATGRIQEVVHQLETWRDVGAIELRFSFATVAEAAPVDPRYFRSGLARLACIERLCGSRALAAPSDVLSYEKDALLSQRPHAKQIVRDDGHWAPQDFSALTFPTREDIVRRAIRDAGFDRKQRRIVERQELDSHGRLTQKGHSRFLRNAPTWVAQVEADFPLSPGARAALDEYVAGRIAGDVMLRLIMGSIQDLAQFALWLERHWTMVSPTIVWLREAGERMKSGWLGLARRVTTIVVQQRQAGMAEERIWTIGNRELAKVARGIVLGRTVGQSIAMHVTDEQIEDLAPSSMLVARMIVALINATVMQRESPREPRVSDAGDLLHVLYLPYVDFFRADAFAADKLERLAPKYARKIVRDIYALPNRIKQALEGDAV